MLNQIETLKPRMRKSERKVADCVLAQPDTVISDSIAALAARAQVSEPTVIRFCRALGCDGYQDFKLRLAQSLASGVRFVHSVVAPDDAPRQVVAKVFDSAVASLLRTRAQLDTAAIERAIDLLASARKIEFYGHGASGIVALDAQHKFFRLAVPTVAYIDAHVHSMSAAILEPGDVVVAISHSGRSKDLIASVQVARAAGAAVVAIAAAGSPLAELAHATISPAVDEDTSTYIPMSSRIVDLVIVDVLAIGVALRRGPDLLRRLEKTKTTLMEKHLS